jgi:hypothetical protein
MPEQFVDDLFGGQHFSMASSAFTSYTTSTMPSYLDSSLYRTRFTLGSASRLHLMMEMITRVKSASSNGPYFSPFWMIVDKGQEKMD